MPAAPVPTELLDTLAAVERGLLTLVTLAAEEGFEVEIAAEVAGNRVVWIPQLVRRITAEQAAPPPLSLV